MSSTSICLRKTLLAAFVVSVVWGCSEGIEQSSDQSVAVPQQALEETTDSAMTEANPFFLDWDTPYGIPPFAQIRDEHYRDAFDRAIAENRSDIDRIRNNPEPATFENTFEALQLAGPLLRRVKGVFGNITNTETNDYLQELELEIQPVLTGESDLIYLDEAIFERVSAVYEQRESLDLDEQALRLVELTYLDFKRRGAALDEQSKFRMKEINAKISTLNTVFAQNLLKETKGFELVVTEQSQLSGLPDSLVGSAKKKAEIAGHENAWVFGLDRATYESFMTFSDQRDLREQMFAGYRNRAAIGGDNDNRDVLTETARLRAERAELLGYANHAEYQLETRMAKTSEKAENFLLEVWKPGLQRAQQELAEMQVIVEEQGHDFLIEGWDWWYYAEKLRQKKYAIDESEVKPYFELQNVREGAFHVANKLFGVTFEELVRMMVEHDLREVGAT